MKPSSGLAAALIPGLAGALAACGGGPSATAVNAWQSCTGGKDVTKVAQSLAAANQEVLSGNTADAPGGAILPFGLALQAVSDPRPLTVPPSSGRWLTCRHTGTTLRGLDKDGGISVLTGTGPPGLGPGGP